MRIKWFSLVRVTGLLLCALPFLQKSFPGGFHWSRYFLHLLQDSWLQRSWLMVRVMNRLHLAFLKRRFYKLYRHLCFMVLVVMPLYLYGPTWLWLVLGLRLTVFGLWLISFEMAAGGSYESNFISASLPSYVELGLSALLCALAHSVVLS